MLNPSEVLRFPDGDALGRALASEIADRIQLATDSGRAFVLGCPGGRTPTSTYLALADEFVNRGTDLRGLIVVMMDDYVEADGDGWAHVAEDAHFSCRRFAWEEIQAVLSRGVAPQHALPRENVWFPDPANPAAYDDRIRELGGIDFFILASGAGDGHVAFNPPGSELPTRTRVVELAEQTRRDNLATFPDFDGINAVPTHGVTVGISTIAEMSKAAAMILIGADKRIAFQKLSIGTGYDPAWPSTVFRLIPDACLYVEDSVLG